MKATIIFILMLAICGNVFHLSHHRKNPDLFKPRTLAGVYRDFFRQIRGRFTRSMRVMFLLGLAGMMSSFYPAVLVLMVRWSGRGPGESGGLWFVLGGLVAALGALVNLAAMIATYLTFAWGSTSPKRDETAGFFVIPIFQGIFAAVSIGIGFSGTLFSLAGKLVMA